MSRTSLQPWQITLNKNLMNFVFPLQLHRIEFVHSRHLIYRDVKPENFLIGRSSTKKDKVIHIIGEHLVRHFVCATPGAPRCSAFEFLESHSRCRRPLRLTLVTSALKFRWQRNKKAVKCPCCTFGKCLSCDVAFLFCRLWTR